MGWVESLCLSMGRRRIVYLCHILLLGLRKEEFTDLDTEQETQLAGVHTLLLLTSDLQTFPLPHLPPSTSPQTTPRSTFNSLSLPITTEHSSTITNSGETMEVHLQLTPSSQPMMASLLPSPSL